MEVLPPGDVQDLFVAVAATRSLPPRDLIDLLADGDGIVAGSRAFPALIHGADTVPHPIHRERPEWLTVFHTLPEPTSVCRRGILDLATGVDLPMTAYHVPFPGIGREQAKRDAWRLEPAASRP